MWCRNVSDRSKLLWFYAWTGTAPYPQGFKYLKTEEKKRNMSFVCPNWSDNLKTSLYIYIHAWCLPLRQCTKNPKTLKHSENINIQSFIHSAPISNVRLEAAPQKFNTLYFHKSLKNYVRIIFYGSIFPFLITRVRLNLI